jgi:hypothetical protein
MSRWRELLLTDDAFRLTWQKRFGADWSLVDFGALPLKAVYVAKESVAVLADFRGDMLRRERSGSGAGSESRTDEAPASGAARISGPADCQNDAL